MNIFEYLYKSIISIWSSLVTQTVKNLPAMQETWVWSLGWKIPWRRKWQPISVFLPGKFHGQRSLAGYSPWGHKDLDTAKQRLHIYIYIHIYIYGKSKPSENWLNNFWHLNFSAESIYCILVQSRNKTVLPFPLPHFPKAVCSHPTWCLSHAVIIPCSLSSLLNCRSMRTSTMPIFLLFSPPRTLNSIWFTKVPQMYQLFNE